ncbi:MAG: bifunctional 4-hydroxy-3-methylbut-2-enyl diphosphate reductase/30S ribosomal protein S1 [Oscillospiraceae bacterium]|nr:bifunctional 4-hydroxy-3-methylbut-2-enyl diphosphate reductase/30S ribosomal protein S1 [Oscillospiraceae bacterium]
MSIKVAKSAGFCFGVDRAVKLVYEEIEKGGKVATYGPIIHNTNVVNEIEAKGVRIVNKLSDLQNDERLILRSHGVGKNIYDELKEMGNEYIDATCPFVARIHKIVREQSEQGKIVLIAGDREHPEVDAIVKHCPGECYVFADEEELKEIFQKNYGFLKKKVAIVAQTTYNIIVWNKCIDIIPDTLKDVTEIFQTICNATSDRQHAAIELAKSSDVMIVIGGKHSSNTIKLFSVCSKYCRTYHIENSDELYDIDLSGASDIGITAGASTPAYIIKEVIQKMSEIQKTQEEEINFAEALEQSFKKIHTGERIKGIIVAVNNSEAIVDIGTKHTGFISLSELTNDPSKKPADVVSVGEEVDLVVIKINDQDGIATLSKKKVDEMVGFDNIVKAMEEGKILEGTVQRAVKGGVIVLVDGVGVFVPASHTGLGRDEDIEKLVKQQVSIKLIDVIPQRRRAVGSIKLVQKAIREEAQKKFWETAEVGAVYKGEVKSITNYGAFVDLGGIDGMVHVSELSWKRIKHPSEVVKVGDVLEVYIKELNSETGRISLGYRKSEDNPWEKFKASYNVGDVVKATVVSITPFGAFASIIDGVDGLIHISQIANQRVDNVKDVLSVGQEVEAKITECDIENKRVSLSMRALLADENAADEAEDNE